VSSPESNADAVRARFVNTAAEVGRHTDARAEQLAARVRSLLDLSGDERALDAGAGTGGLAFALAPLVREVVALDLVPEMLEEGRRRGGAHPNVTFVEGDVTALPFANGEFDLVGALMLLHHVARPEVVMAELVRVTHLGGTLLVIDQVAPADPLAALELNRFERTRDPSNARVLSDADLRGLFEQNGLVVTRDELVDERRELEPYLDLAGCSGEARQQALNAAPARDAYRATVGWFVLAKRAYGT
jgi:ubiquinone/menaquinone biosynthesis C-methylase UbiE